MSRRFYLELETRIASNTRRRKMVLLAVPACRPSPVHPSQWCIRVLGVGGCRRILDSRGFPGTCNGDNQRTCFYPKNFNCTCLSADGKTVAPERHEICLAALRICTCSATDFDEAVKAEERDRAEERERDKIAKKSGKTSGKTSGKNGSSVGVRRCPALPPLRTAALPPLRTAALPPLRAAPYGLCACRSRRWW